MADIHPPSGHLPGFELEIFAKTVFQRLPRLHGSEEPAKLLLVHGDDVMTVSNGEQVGH
ncbi:uncharacterized protein METZ01_LOCUS297589, partial [marine metagenome]